MKYETHAEVFGWPPKKADKLLSAKNNKASKVEDHTATFVSSRNAPGRVVMEGSEAA